jgi:diguanylate cyclase
MSQADNAKLRPLIVVAAVCLGLIAASFVIWPLWLSEVAPHVFGSTLGKDGIASRNLIIVGSILGLMCLNIVSLMLPDTRTIDASMAKLTERIADPDSTVLGIEREIASNLDRVVSLLKSHSEVSRIYSVSLENAGRNLIELTSPEQLRLAIGFLITENNKMRKETNNLQSNLEQSHSQIESLRENLELAEETGMRDALTSLWNRRAFEKMLDLQIASASQKTANCCVILADIDHFKRINDKFGHLVGDEILRLVANTLSKNVKGRDTVTRFGGEEFALILPETSLENAKKLATQIKNQLEIQKWVISKRNEAVGTVTASFGIAQMQPGESRDALVGRADKRLYEAKSAGRNRIAS